MRNAFAAELGSQLDGGRELLLLTADLGYSVFDDLKSRHPAAFFNTGIAENAMVGLAAGLAMTGTKVFAYGISKFIANKCFEQVREDVCLHALPVVLVGVGSGLAYGQAGFTHFSTNDIGCLRTIPGLTILTPADPHEVRLLVRACLDHPEPVFLRLGKSGDAILSERPTLRIGDAYVLHEGGDVAIAGYGNVLAEAVRARASLAAVGVGVTVASVPTLKPLHDEFFVDLANRHERFYVLEEHSVIGGLGDALAHLQPGRLAVPDTIHTVCGDVASLRAAAGIDAASIEARVRADLGF